MILIFLYFSKRDYGLDLFYTGEILTFLDTGLEIDKTFAFTLLLIKNYSNDDAVTLFINIDSDYFRGYVGYVVNPYFLDDFFA